MSLTLLGCCSKCFVSANTKQRFSIIILIILSTFSHKHTYLELFIWTIPRDSYEHALFLKKIKLSAVFWCPLFENPWLKFGYAGSTCVAATNYPCMRDNMHPEPLAVRSLLRRYPSKLQINAALDKIPCPYWSTELSSKDDLWLVSMRVRFFGSIPLFCFCMT